MNKRIFKIPVGNMTREEAEEQIRELMKKFNSPPTAYFVRKEREKKLKRIFKDEIC